MLLERRWAYTINQISDSELCIQSWIRGKELHLSFAPERIGKPLGIASRDGKLGIEIALVTQNDELICLRTTFSSSSFDFFRLSDDRRSWTQHSGATTLSPSPKAPSFGLQTSPAPWKAPQSRLLVGATDAHCFVALSEVDPDGAVVGRLFRLSVGEPPRLTQLWAEGGWELRQLVCGGAFGLLRDARGRLASFGVGSKGELGLGSCEGRAEPEWLELLSGLSPVKDVAVGTWHALAQLEDGDAYTWGWNESGQLGLDAAEGMSDAPTLVELEEPISAVACGARHSILLTGSGAVYAAGALGQPSEEKRPSGWRRLNLEGPVSAVGASGWTSTVFRTLSDESLLS